MSTTIAIISHRIQPSIHENRLIIDEFIRQAAEAKADLVLFSESALTGLINNDRPEHDLLLGVPIPGEITNHFALLAKQYQLYIAFGLFEREEDHLYDAAILLNREGRIVLHYRRMSKGWHWPGSDPLIYREGDHIPVTSLAFGKVCFLLCGDLFEDRITNQLQTIHPNLLLLPYARTVEGKGSRQAIWEKEELPAYQEMVALLAIPTCFSGYIDDEYIGGSMFINAKGEIVKALPIDQEGLLLIKF